MDPEVEQAHREAMERGASTYTDPASGYEVFTAAALAERGTCCGSGCRHCPYDGPGTSAGPERH